MVALRTRIVALGLIALLLGLHGLFAIHSHEEPRGCEHEAPDRHGHEDSDSPCAVCDTICAAIASSDPEPRLLRSDPVDKAIAEVSAIPAPSLARRRPPIRAPPSV